jgi:BirA family biotin operon repressor/biotin-[acetyl-CoA-carboxylase] ligase
MADEFLDADQLRAATFIRHVELHDTLGSTNDRAAELARDATLELPALVAARLQMAGKGRGQHKWWAAEGALTFSVLLEPAMHCISTHAWPQLSLAVAVAVCDALESTMPCEPSIKWPNDVLIRDRKVAGILIESPGGHVPARNRVVIGIGANVNNSWSMAPADLAKRGNAMCDVVGHPMDIQDVLIALLRALETRLDQVAANDRTLHHVWQNRCWLTNRDAIVEVHNQTVSGRCVGIAEDGALLLDINRSIERFYSGSVTVRE